jgi:hypothetical protein
LQEREHRVLRAYLLNPGCAFALVDGASGAGRT